MAAAQLRSLSNQSSKFGAKAAQHFKAMVHFTQFFFESCLNAYARLHSIGCQAENLFDFVEREVQRLRFANEAHAFDELRRVEAVAGL